MSRTHTVTNNAISQPVIIPHPDLLDLVKHYLPGDTAVPVLYSIQGSLNFRIARLAGMIANALASDERARGGGIDSFNDHMSFLDQAEHAAHAFNQAGADRKPMIESLRELTAYRQSVNDYFASKLGETKIPVTDWASTISMAGEPMPPDQSQLNLRWKIYVAQCAAQKTEPLITRKQYDDQSIIALSGKRQSWASHVASVMNIIDAATSGQAIEFFQLDKRTQLSLLMKYAAPSANDRQAIADQVIKQARRGTTEFEMEATMRLRYAFADACLLASTHPRYATEGDQLTEAVKPKELSSAAIAEATRLRNAPHAKDIDAALQAQKREQIARQLADAKALKPKRQPKPKAVPATVTPTPADVKLADMPNDLM